jgi:hypothetical protein
MDAYDDILAGIASRQGNIAGFLDAVFSFLHRRTDFYVVDSSPRPHGFLPNEAEKIVRE